MRKFLTLLLLGVALNSTGQSRKIDSLYAVLANVNLPSDTTRVNTLLLIADLVRSFDLTKSKEESEKALALAQSLGYAKGEAGAHLSIAAYHIVSGDYEKATIFGFSALEMYEKLNYKSGIARCYSMFGRLYRDMKSPEKSLYYWRKSVVLNKSLHNQSELGLAYNGIGSMYLNLDQFDSSLYYHKLALKVRQEVGVKTAISQSYINVASVLLELKEYDQSIEYNLKALTIENNEGNNPSRLTIILGNLGKVYMYKKDYAKANEYLSQALAMGEKLGDLRLMVNLYVNLSELEEKRNNLDKALQYERLRSHFKDSLFDEQKNEHAAQAEARFETQKKEKEIQLLAQQNRIQKIWRNILIAGFVLLVIASIAGYKWQLYRTRKNLAYLNIQIDLLTSQNQELTKKYQQNFTDAPENFVESQDQRLIRKALEIIEQNISDSSLSVDKLASELGMSRATLYKKLKSVTGFSPGDFIRTVRLKRAAHLLLKNADSVAQIGFAVGFEDQSYFSKSFRKQFGVNPSEYSQNAHLSSSADAGA